MHKYGESRTTRIMMATAPQVTSGLGLSKFQADGFLLTRVYMQHQRTTCNMGTRTVPVLQFILLNLQNYTAASNTETQHTCNSIFFIIKPTRCTSFPNLLQHETLHVSDSSSAHHQEFIHCTLSNGIFHTGLKNRVPSWSCSKAVFKPIWHIPSLSVRWMNSWWWTEELSEICRASCRSKFGKLGHLVGFIIKKFVTMHSDTNVKSVQRYDRAF